MFRRITTIAGVLAVALLGAGLAWAAIGGPLLEPPFQAASDSTVTSDPGGSTTTTQAGDPGSTTTTEPEDDGTTTTTEAEDPGTTTTTEPEDDGTTTTTEPEDDGTTTTTEPEDDAGDVPAATYQAADAGSVTLAVEGGSLVLVSVDPNPGWVVDEVETGTREVEVEFRSGDTTVKFKAEVEDGAVQIRVRVETDDDDGTTTTTEPEDDEMTTTTEPEQEAVDLPATTYQAGDAGSVTVAVEGGNLVLVSVDPSAGWTVDEVDARSDEVEVEFRSGDTEVRFEAEFEDGQIQIRVRVDG